ncbi:MAG: Wzz/FepE/Etk N-terminal domain-containing protein, partial [Candidatus Omnitrophica bacterium]|nr:Wzz/FepE/Etk N-terminal domain-containing protein [Candidatus Omnitrophota bacterium]
MNNDFRKEINRESQDENIEIDFQEIYTKLLKHRQTIYTSVLICVVFSLLYSFISRPVYRATTRIMVDARPPKIVKVEEVILPDYTDRTNYYNSQIEVLKSRAVANLVSDELGNYEPWGRRGKTENKLTKITEDDRVNSLLDNIKIKPVRMTQIIEISAEDIDPNLAAKIANTWTSAYILFSSVDQLVQRKSELEADISQQMKYFKEKHPVIQGLRAEIAVIQSQINNEKDRIISPSSKVSGYNVLKNDVKITNVKVLDNAQVPKSPARPKKLINLLLALFLGLFGGVGLAFFFESLDQSIKLSSDIEGILKLSCLTIVPSYVQTEVRDEKKGEKKEEVEEEIKEEAKKEEREGEKERTVSSLISHQDRHSSVAEAFRR